MSDEIENSIIAHALKKLSQAESGWGKVHPKVIRELRNLSDLYLVLEKYSNAEPIYFRILEIQHKLYGLSHPVVAETLLSLGELHEAQDNTRFAEQFYLGALWIIDQNDDVRSPILGRLLLKLYGIHKINDNKRGTQLIESRLSLFLNVDKAYGNVQPLIQQTAVA